MKLFVLFLSLFLSSYLISQNCPYIGPDLTLPCGQTSTTLNADLSQCSPGLNPNATTNYQNTQIPYVSQTNTGTSLTMTDDSQQGPFNIGFTFCFYGNTYNQFYIGSNGWISFSPNQPTTYTSASIPSVANPVNSVMGAWQDWNPGIGGQVRYQVQGTAPCRKLVVSWINVPFYSCTSVTGTFHIVLYESTNIIEVHIQNKQFCAWANGTAVQGIQNSNGTQAVTTPGRNSTQWTAQNDGRRWTPSGNPVTPTPTWYQVGNPVAIGTGLSITVTPLPIGSYYTCHLEYPSCFSGWNSCNGQTGLGPDTIFILPGNTGLLPPLVQSTNPSCNGYSDGSIILNPQNGTPPFTINWSNSMTGSNITGLTSGTYIATIFDSQGCNVVTSPITLTDPPIPTTSQITGTDTICIGSNSEIFSVNPNPNFQYLWQTTGTVTSGQGTNQVTIDFSQNNGQVTIEVTPSSNGCQGTSVQLISTILDINPVITQIGPFCIYENCQQLTAQPNGGQFSGVGVIGNTFCPQQTNLPVNQINYTYTISGCQFSTTSNIVVTPKPTILEITPDNAFIQICDGNDSATVTLSVLSDQLPSNNYWIVGGDTILSEVLLSNFGEGITTVHVFVESNGCFSDIESTTVNITKCPEVIYYIPNSFTPDGDEHNQMFEVVFTSGFSPSEFHLEIFNRWGEIIWESFDHTAKWDGTFGGKICQPGIYTWKIRFGNEDNDGFNLIHGHFNLLK
jgi:gliding motility-associated-like protein